MFVHWTNAGDPFNPSDWVLAGFQHVGPFPLTDFDNGGGPGQPTVEIRDQGTQKVLEFFVPDVVDQLPLKLARAQDSWTGFGNISRDVTAPGASSAFVDIKLVRDDPPTVYLDWEIRPNPNYEFFTYTMDPTIDHFQVVIDTVSIPEPSTFILLTTGTVGLIACAWRKRRQR